MAQVPELNPISETQRRCGGVSRQTIYNLVDRGELQRVNIGRRAFITGDSIERFLRNLTGEPAA